MNSRVVARVTAALAVGMMAVAVANLLGWEPYPWTPAGRGLPEPESRSLFYSVTYGVGALMWATFALAFLGRAGEGALRRAPRWLITVICWYAVLSVVWSILSSLGILVMGWNLVLMVVEVLFVGFGVTALLATGRQLPTSDPLTADHRTSGRRAGGRGGGPSVGALPCPSRVRRDTDIGVLGESRPFE